MQEPAPEEDGREATRCVAQMQREAVPVRSLRPEKLGTETGGGQLGHTHGGDERDVVEVCPVANRHIEQQVVGEQARQQAEVQAQQRIQAVVLAQEGMGLQQRDGDLQRAGGLDAQHQGAWTGPVENQRENQMSVWDNARRKRQLIAAHGPAEATTGLHDKHLDTIQLRVGDLHQPVIGRMRRDIQFGFEPQGGALVTEVRCCSALPQRPQAPRFMARQHLAHGQRPAVVKPVGERRGQVVGLSFSQHKCLGRSAQEPDRPEQRPDPPPPLLCALAKRHDSRDSLFDSVGRSEMRSKGHRLASRRIIRFPYGDFDLHSANGVDSPPILHQHYIDFQLNAAVRSGMDASAIN
ncbi:hypothetical protein FQZ97_853220 [compost metagenome]